MTHAIPLQAISLGRDAFRSGFARLGDFQSRKEDVAEVGAWRHKFAEKEEEASKSDGFPVSAPRVEVHVGIRIGD